MVVCAKEIMADNVDITIIFTNFIFTFPIIQASSEMQGKMTAEEQSIKPTPAVIIKPPVLFRKPPPTIKPPPIKSSPMTRPSVSAAKIPIPTGKPSAPPSQLNIPIPISTAATAQVSVPMVKTSTGMNQERWDEDSFQGLWDSSEDKGLKSEYDLSTSDSSLPSSISLVPSMAPHGKPPIIHQTVDYGHGHSHGQGKCC